MFGRRQRCEASCAMTCRNLWVVRRSRHASVPVVVIIKWCWHIQVLALNIFVGLHGAYCSVKALLYCVDWEYHTSMVMCL